MGGLENESLAEVFIQQTREALALEHRRIVHCLKQLDEEQIWHRPEPHVNSIGTIIVHLCGNLRQWFLHGFGGEKDIRDRPAEFAPPQLISKDALAASFGELIARIDRLLAGLPRDVLVESKCLQGFEMTGLGAILTTITHLEGHALQIAYITRMLTGDRYEPFWKPVNTEQGA